MTEARILKLDWIQAINEWSYWHDKLEESPDNEINQYREEKAWENIKGLFKIICKKGLAIKIFKQ